MRFISPLLAVTAPIGYIVLGSAPASALAVTPSPTTVTVDFTHTEAQAITALNLGPVLGRIPPNFTPEAQQRLGDNISRIAHQAAQTPGSTLTILIDQPVTAPPGVSVTVTR
ncbi:hypothetical protein [Nocardia brevicatena]|uniref:hypothetical protein n=1 Tax=Nocardia brevicatena TaxID=37327 RepID=UPI0002F1AA8F|nr:hypothetical protein [Nocardia brevicatena]